MKRYRLHCLDLPDLNAEIRLAWHLGQYRAHERLAELGITDEIGNHLMIGAMPVVTKDRLFRPAIASDTTDRWMCVMPTRFIDGHVFDLLAVSMEPAGWWLRRGEEGWLGDPGDSPYQTKVLAWLRSCGKGSVWIGGQ